MSQSCVVYRIYDVSGSSDEKSDDSDDVDDDNDDDKPAETAHGMLTSGYSHRTYLAMHSYLLA